MISQIIYLRKLINFNYHYNDFDFIPFNLINLINKLQRLNNTYEEK